MTTVVFERAQATSRSAAALATMQELATELLTQTCPIAEEVTRRAVEAEPGLADPDDPTALLAADQSTKANVGAILSDARLRRARRGHPRAGRRARAVRAHGRPRRRPERDPSWLSPWHPRAVADLGRLRGEPHRRCRGALRRARPLDRRHGHLHRPRLRPAGRRLAERAPPPPAGAGGVRRPGRAPGAVRHRGRRPRGSREDRPPGPRDSHRRRAAPELELPDTDAVARHLRGRRRRPRDGGTRREGTTIWMSFTLEPDERRQECISRVLTDAGAVGVSEPADGLEGFRTSTARPPTPGASPRSAAPPGRPATATSRCSRCCAPTSSAPVPSPGPSSARSPPTTRP